MTAQSALHTFLIVLLSVLTGGRYFHGKLLGQVNQSDRALSKHGYTVLNKAPVHFSPGAHHFGSPATRFPGELSSNVNRLQPVLPDSSMFQPVAGPYGGTVRSIAVASDGWLFLATDGEVYRSTDNGLSWSINLFPSQLHNYVEPVTILGLNTIVAETDFSNFISTDRGETWNVLGQDVRGFAVETTGEIYAGSDYGGVKISLDTAKSWMPFSLAGERIWKVVLCGDGRFACPSDSGTYYSIDAGKTWVFRSYETAFTWNLVSDGTDRLFALRYYGTNFQLFRSTDFGVSWDRVILPDSDPYEDAYRVYIEEDRSVLVVTSDRIVHSIDGGDTWTSLGSPLGEGALTAGRDSNGNLLAGTFYGVHRWDESTNGWEEINNGIRAATIAQIAFTPLGSLIAFSRSECFRSPDGGMTWSKVIFQQPFEARPPILSTSSGNILVAASFWSNEPESGLLRSTDDGASWEWISVLSNYYAIYGTAEGASGDILATTYGGDIYRSTDEGDSWRKVDSSVTRSEITSLAADKAGNFYAARRDTSMLVSNDGVTWNRILLDRRYSSYESISIDSHGEVFFSSSSEGVYHSPDTGKSWNLLNEGLINRYVLSTASDDSGNVVLGTGKGVFRLADSVDTWSWFSDGLPQTFTTAVAVSPGGFLYAGFQNFGMYKTTAPLGTRVPRFVEPPPPPPEGIADFRLHQNYPNPFNGQTVVRYEVPLPARVEIKVHNILGEAVAPLFVGELAEGFYEVEWAPKDLASGVYFCQMKASTSASTYLKTIKILYLR